VMEMPVAGRPTVVPASEPPAEPTSTHTGPVDVLPLRTESEPVKPQRLVVSPERLIEVLQTKLQAAAETAVQAAVSRHLEPALTRALASIEEKHSAAIRGLLETLTQQRTTLVRNSREEMAARIEDRLVEVRGRWDDQLEGYRIRAEEIVQRLDRQA